MTTVAPPPVSAPLLQQTRDHLLERVERRLSTFLAAERQRWQHVNHRAAQPIDAITELVARGGRRLRPVFFLSGFLASGGSPGNDVAVDGAAALELLQAFALIQDDEARGVDEGSAALAGELALVHADRLTGRFTGATRKVWDELRTEMIIGRHLEVAVAAESLADPRLSRWVAVCKSGRSVVHRPLVLGATLAGRPDLASAFEGYGLALGEAFQLRDELVDAFGGSETSGRPGGLGFVEPRMTLLLALAAGRDPRVQYLLDKPAPGPWDAELLHGLLEETGVPGAVERTIAALVDRACAALAETDLDPAWQKEFALLATNLAYRTH